MEREPGRSRLHGVNYSRREWSQWSISLPVWPSWRIRPVRQVLEPRANASEVALVAEEQGAFCPLGPEADGVGECGDGRGVSYSTTGQFFARKAEDEAAHPE